MALSGNTVWEVRPVGNDTNGGGFVAGASGTDWSQQDAPQYSVTDAVANGTTTVTSATASFGADVVGNIAYIGGAWYQITARNSATSITVDRTITTATGLTLKIGGGFASIGRVGSVRVAGNDAFIKAGNYTITTATFNVSGGCFDDTTSGQGGTDNPIQFTGYDTNRTYDNTDANRPVFTLASGVSSATMFRVSGTWCTRFLNLVVDGNLQTSSRGFNFTTALNWTERCLVRNCTNGGVENGSHIALELTGCTTTAAATNPRNLLACYIHGNSGIGVTSSTTFAVGCVFADNGSHGFHSTTGDGNRFVSCVAYGNGGSGWFLGTSGRYNSWLINCIAYGNGGYGFGDNPTSARLVSIRNCAAGSNTSGNFGLTGNAEGSVTLTADPFTGAVNGDFSLNSAAGGGALLKGTGYPQTMPVV